MLTAHLMVLYTKIYLWERFQKRHYWYDGTYVYPSTIHPTVNTVLDMFEQ